MKWSHVRIPELLTAARTHPGTLFESFPVDSNSTSSKPCGVDEPIVYNSRRKRNNFSKQTQQELAMEISKLEAGAAEFEGNGGETPG